MRVCARASAHARARVHAHVRVRVRLFIGVHACMHACISVNHNFRKSVRSRTPCAGSFTKTNEEKFAMTKPIHSCFQIDPIHRSEPSNLHI